VWFSCRSCEEVAFEYSIVDAFSEAAKWTGSGVPRRYAAAQRSSALMLKDRKSLRSPVKPINGPSNRIWKREENDKVSLSEMIEWAEKARGRKNVQD